MKRFRDKIQLPIRKPYCNECFKHCGHYQNMLKMKKKKTTEQTENMFQDVKATV